MLLLNNADVARVLTMSVCLDALEGAFREIAAGDAAGMGRIDLYVPSGVEAAPYYRWAVMAGGSKRDGYVCSRFLSDMVSWPSEYGSVRENKYAGQPGTFCGFILLFSVKNAEPVALINDGMLQHVRVGGGAGLGVKYLSRADSASVGMIGSGGMARAYLDALCLVRRIERVKVFSPNAEHAQRYAAEMSEQHGLEVEVVGSARAAVQGVDIAACCTSSNQPVLRNEWIEPGVHVTNVTSGEIPPDLYRAVDVAVRAGEATPRLADPGPSTFHARAGFLAYVAGSPRERALVPRLDLPTDVLELPHLAELMAGRTAGRTRPEQSSFFLNVGAIGVQFEALAAAVYERARDAGIGTQIPTDWFLQDVRD